MARPIDRWTTIDGAVVHFIDTAPGTAGPSILVIPGFLSSTDSFLQLACSLPSTLRVVVVDLPGFGRSEPPAAAWSRQFITRFIERFMDQAGLASAALVGSSMGAGIAMHAAVVLPARVSGLILLSPLGPERRPFTTALAALDRALPLLCALIPRWLVTRLVSAQVVDPGVLTADVLAASWRPFRSAAGRRAVVQVARTLLAGGAFDGILCRVEQPLLVVEGSANPLGGPKARTELARVAPACSMEVIEGCGHILPLEAPQRLARIIARFCAGSG